MWPFCSIFGLCLQNKNEARFRRDHGKVSLIKTGVSIHIVKRHIISVALVALIGLMLPLLAFAADFAHGE